MKLKSIFILLGGILAWTVAEPTLSAQPAITPTWTYTLDGSQRRPGIATAVAIGRQSDTLVTGALNRDLVNGGYEIVTFKLSPGGSLSWEARHSFPGVRDQGGLAVTTDPQGNCYVAAQLFSAEGGADVGILKYSPTGKLLWSNRYSSPTNNSPSGSSFDIPQRIHVDVAGRVLVAGQTGGGVSEARPMFIATFGSNGVFLWQDVFQPRADVEQQANGILVDSQGRVYAGGAPDIVIYDLQGRRASSKTSWAKVLLLDAAENLVTAGIEEDDLGSPIRIVVEKTQVAGEATHFGSVVFRASYLDTVGLGGSVPTDMKLDSDGNAYVLGTASLFCSTNANCYQSISTLLKFSSDPNRASPLWVSHYRAEQDRNLVPMALQLDQRRNVHVVGQLSGFQYPSRPHLLRYDERGTLLMAGGYLPPHFQILDLRSVVFKETGPAVLAGAWSPHLGMNANAFVIEAALAVSPTAPVLVQGPVTQSVAAGSNAVFRVEATSATPLRYQWMLDGEDILGADQFEWTIVRADSSAKGNYSVRVSNAFGSITTASGVLGIFPAVRIHQQPSSQVVLKGESAAFQVLAEGTGTLRYQWHHNNVPIQGANEPLLVIPQVPTNQSGAYTVAISDTISHTLSAPALLRISREAKPLSAVVGHAQVFPRFAEYGRIGKDASGSVYSAISGAGVTRHQDNGVALWTTPFPAELTAMAVSADGYVALAGFTTEAVDDFYTTLYRPNGSVVWTRELKSVNLRIARATSVALDPEGNVLVSGWFLTSQPGATQDQILLKYSPTGAVLWQRIHDSTGKGHDMAGPLAVDSEGSVYAANQVSGGNPQSFVGVEVIKYSSLGTQLWTYRHQVQGATWMGAQSLFLPPLGGVLVTGNLALADTGSDGMLFRLNSDGDRLWQVRQDRQTEGDELFVDAVLSPDGGIVISGSGTLRSENVYDEEEGETYLRRVPVAMVWKFGLDGTLLWTSQHKTEDLSSASSIAVNSDGWVAITGRALQPDGDSVSMVTTVVYDASGTQRWLGHYCRTEGVVPGKSLWLDSNTLWTTGLLNPNSFSGEGRSILIRYESTGNGHLPAVSLAPNPMDLPTNGSGELNPIISLNPSLALQWWFGGEALANQTNTTLRFTHVGTNDSGLYSLEICDETDCVRTQVSSVQVHPEIRLLATPESQCVVLGASVEFSVQVAHPNGTRYQWYHNGQALPDADRRVLSIPSSAEADAGTYTVRVENPFGSAEATASLRFLADVRRSAAVLLQDGEHLQGVPLASALDSQGNLYIAGSGGSSLFGTRDLVLRKVARNGQTLWKAAWKMDGAASGFPYVAGIQLDATGNVFVAWTHPSATQTYPYLLKYSSEGALIWNQSNVHLGEGAVTGLAVAPDGSSFVCGMSSDELIVVKHDPAGKTVWEARHRTAPNTLSMAKHLALSVDGSLYVAGYETATQQRTFNEQHSLFIKLRANGSKEWVQSGQATPSESKEGILVQPLLSGNIWFACRYFTNHVPDQLTLSLHRPDGSVIRTFVQANHYSAHWADSGLEAVSKPVAMTVMPDGSSLVRSTADNIYYPQTGQTLASAWLHRFDAAGTEQWKVSIPQVSPSEPFAVAAAVDSSSNVYMTVQSFQEVAGTVRVIKYDAAGNLMWNTAPSETYSSVHSPIGLHADLNQDLVLTASSDSAWFVQRFVQAELQDLPALAVAGPKYALLGTEPLLSVTPAGTARASYQWLYDGQTIAHATKATISFPAIQLSQTGNYSVVVDNGVFCRTTPAHRLLVYASPSFRGFGVRGETVSFAFNGAPGVPFIIESSRNLSLWTPIHTNQNPFGQTLYQMPRETERGGHFLRARLLEP